MIAPKRMLALAVAFCVTGAVCLADDWPQWRGPRRDGISQEKGLLGEWPKGGPKLVWQIDDLGDGYSTPAVADGRLYVIANQGLEDEFVKSLAEKDGTLIWSQRIGKVGNPKQQPSYPAARSTPTVDGKWMFALGSDGDLVCMATGDGKVRWHKNLREDFAGKPGVWAYSESPLVDGDVLVCTPGGKEATLVALDKLTGEVVWKSPLPEGDDAAYSSPIAIEVTGVKQYVQLLQKGLVGVDAKTGKLLWRYARPISRFDANIPTPVADEGYIYVASAGTGGGAVKLAPAGDGQFKPEEIYFTPQLPTAIGGAVKIGDYLYGTTNQALLCVEFTSGKVKWQERALGAASLCYADGRLYLHGENGAVALVEPTPEGYHEKGRITLPDQSAERNLMGKAWAYPVVANGRLYIRDRDLLWSFDIER
ncbi:MAG TPA: PQQ-binding-like beta-propeller repeat protein [Pirellulales bacterium]|nr:PQQ-binding-like beta-propeller repeat protein [Pirellulales bacterium]